MTSLRTNTLLAPGQTVTTHAGHVPLTVGPYAGGGGQGQVYHATMNGRQIAIKWFLPEYLATDPGLYSRLQRLIGTGPPTDRFLWPMETVGAAGVPAFGYIMPWREERFRPLRDHFSRVVKPSLSVLSTVALELAWSFRELHGHGFSYRDISYDNCFFDPRRGEVRVCDNDNVDRDDQPGGVLGTPYFMAPELVRGETHHSRATDLYSLSVLLFYVLHVAHPLIGRRIMDVEFPDDADLRRLLANEPLFILDPGDRGNRPLPRAHDPQGESGTNVLEWWPLYPRYIHELFMRAFTDGIANGQGGRVQEGEWMTALARLRDSLSPCPHCGGENSFHVSVDREDGKPPRPCWRCARPLPRPLHLVTRRSLVVLTSGRSLYGHHLDKAARFDFTKPLATVEAHPGDAGKLGLRNLSATAWTVTKEDGRERSVEPGHLFPLLPGRAVDFGTMPATVHA
jgi:DNA-binding helix-hairpin-helix protein with protein kinase domain